MLAILAVWTALGALITTLYVILFHAGESLDVEMVITVLPYTIAFSATLAAAVLWGLRKQRHDEEGVAGQRLQATTSIVINSVSFAALLFALQDFQFALAGLVLEYGFLWVVYWSYTRVIVPEEPE